MICFGTFLSLKGDIKKALNAHTKVKGAGTQGEPMFKNIVKYIRNQKAGG